jgi:DNA-directed RNA polymerase subunit F
MNPKTISEEPMNMATVKLELEKIRKRDTDLNIRATKTEEYVKQCFVLKKKEADELYKKIADMDISRIKDIHIHKIIDIMPLTVEELKSLLTGYTISLSGENLKKVVEAVAEYSPQKK